MLEVEKTVQLAFICASCLYGEAAVRLSCAYCVGVEKRGAVVRWADMAGDDLIRLVIGLCAREYGDTAFRVEIVQPNEPDADPWPDHDHPAAAASADGSAPRV